MQHARLHHYVPACYLRHFAVPNDRFEGRLLVYDRLTGRSFASSPHNSACERDFYAVEVRGESADFAEGAYSKLEALFAPVIAGVNERGTLPTEPIRMRELLAFVASQAVRTPRERRLMAGWYNDIYMLFLRGLADDKGAYMKRLQEAEPEITDSDAEEMFETHLAFLNAKGARVEMDQTTLVGSALKVAIDLEDLLATRIWILGVAPDGTSFITSDDPVHMEWAGRSSTVPPGWVPAFGDPDTTVSIALGPRLLLMGLCYDPGRARKRYSRKQVAARNTDVALAARRFVYSVNSTFVQIASDGSIIAGPSEALRMPDVVRTGTD